MKKLHINPHTSFCFIGIGGIGISALAKLLVHQGHVVHGVNDSESGETLDELRALGVPIDLFIHGSGTTPHAPEADVYVYSVAWENRAPELMEAVRKTGKPVVTYFEALGEVSRAYKTIAIAGTHGKTTTTAMVGHILVEAGLDPTVIVGSLVDWHEGGRSNFRAGKSEYLVVEACEYKRHFLQLHPQVLGVTNIELDHPDYYRDDADVHDAFDTLIAQSGAIFSSAEAGAMLAHVPPLLLPGEHNRSNAALAMVICRSLGVSTDSMRQALVRFKGTWRRFEYKGKTKAGALVYDDYAHHPTAIRATLHATRELYPDKKIVAVFEAHMFSRTARLLDDFAQAFGEADEVVIAPIYPAREAPIEGIDQYTLASKIETHLVAVAPAESLAAAAAQADARADADSVIVFMSAGDIYHHIPHIVV